MIDNFENTVEKTVSELEMEDIYDGAILGYSGGADSSALMHFLKSRCKNLLCVHINHGIRGDEADRDESFARQSCAEHGIRFLSFKIDVPALARKRKRGLEEVAREERYKIFFRLLYENPEYKCIVTAHNSDDNLETVIFNLARGSGIRGICGISPRIDKVVRPLIRMTKAEILEYCEKNGVKYITDSTNFDTAYTRNHIRHNVIPHIRDINPRAHEASCRMGELLRSDMDYLDSEAQKIIEENSIADTLPRQIATSLHISMLTRILKAICPTDLDYTALSDIVELINGWECGKYINLRGGISFKLERSYCAFVSTEDLSRLSYDIELSDGVNLIEEAGVAILVNTDKEMDGYFLLDSVTVDENTALCARSRRCGDTLKHGGMTKKLKKLFLEKNIPSHIRDRFPVICDGEGILLVAGVVKRDGVKQGAGKSIKIYAKNKL